LALHLATSDEKWANAARRLGDMQLAMFWDEEGKGCFFTSHEHEALLARTKNAYDSVLPSGNSVTARNLLRLAAFSKQVDYRNRARQTLELLVPLIDEAPSSLTNMALALAEYLDTEDPVVGSRAAPRTRLGIAPDAAIVLAAGQEGDDPKPTQQADNKSAGKSAVVTGQAYLSVDRLPAGKVCKVLVQLNIAEGWHIHANPAGDPEIDMATEVELDSKLGIELRKVNYPAGKKVERGGGSEQKPPLTEGGQAAESVRGQSFGDRRAGGAGESGRPPRRADCDRDIPGLQRCSVPAPQATQVDGSGHGGQSR
jgi:hypothetical protein